MYNMQGLSFREYLHLFHQISVQAYSLEEIMEHKVELPGVKHPLPFFENYLRKGYYPFSLEEEFELKLQQIVNQTLETDIPIYAGMNVSTGLLTTSIVKTVKLIPLIFTGEYAIRTDTLMTASIVNTVKLIHLIFTGEYPNWADPLVTAFQAGFQSTLK